MWDIKSYSILNFIFSGSELFVGKVNEKNSFQLFHWYFSCVFPQLTMWILTIKDWNYGLKNDNKAQICICTPYVIVSYKINLKVKHDKINVWNITTE